jgi:hypothetical protein
MNQINRFTDGVKKHLSYFLYKNTEWTFPSMNIRVMNTDDKGFSVVPLNSNTEAFHVKEGYCILGAKDIDGVLYIVSTEINGDSSEIGIFPSPKIWSTSNQEYERTYKALFNFDDNGVKELNTNLFKFSIHNEVDIILKIVADGSVNIYLSDFNTSNLVINSGFNQKKGSLTGMTITPESFNGSLNLIPISNTPLEIVYKGLSGNGRLKPGVYYAYFRYVDKYLNRTNFIHEVYPIQVHTIGNDKINRGLQEIDIYDNILYVNSSINFEVNINSLDKAYDFLEIALIRYSSTQEGSPIIESFLINRLYPLSSFISNANIIVTGLESISMLIKEEVINSFLPVSKSYTQTIVEDRYYAAQWADEGYNSLILAEFAKNIVVRYAIGATMELQAKYHTSEDTSNTNYFNEKFQKINSLNSEIVTYSKTPYFRGEIYPFAIKFILVNGRYTDAYPISGGDDLSISNYTKETGDVTGLYRFPEFSKANVDVISSIGDPNVFIGVKFDNTDAINYYNQNKEFFSNVIGIVFLRGDRIENLLYQGILLPTIKEVVLSISPYDSVATSTYIPSYDTTWFIEGNSYMSNTEILPIINAGKTTNGEISAIYRRRKQVISNEHKIAVVSPDNLFTINQKIANNSNVYIKELYGFSNLNELDYDIPKGHIYGIVSFIDFSNNGAFSHIEYITNRGYHGKILHVAAGDHNDSSFSALVLDNKGNNDQLFYSNVTEINWNQSQDICDYLGIDTEETIPSDLYNKMVNIYKNENNSDFYQTIRNGYNIISEKYFRISDIFNLTESTNNILIYKGDCFTSQTTFRFTHPYGTDGYDDLVYSGAGDLFHPVGSPNFDVHSLYGHGIIFRLLTENSLNLSMRNEVEAKDPSNLNTTFFYSYYPAFRERNIDILFWLTNGLDKSSLVEARQVNHGYSMLNKGREIYGYDKNRINKGISYPTRIYFSPTSVNGELTDAFRLISPIAYRDYPMVNGPIYKLIDISGSLISIQENKINQHKLGQRTLSSESVSGDIVLKDSGIYLNKETYSVADFGTQHRESVITTGVSVYGVDFKKRIIWSITGAESVSGNTRLSGNDLVSSKMISGWLEQLSNQYSVITDKTMFLNENQTNGIGIVSGYNARYKEVYFTFLLKKNILSIEAGTKEYRAKDEMPVNPYLKYETIYIPENNSWYYCSNNLGLLNGVYTSKTFIDNTVLITKNIFREFRPNMKIEEGYIYYDLLNSISYIAITSYPINTIVSIDELKLIRENNAINEVNISRSIFINKTLVYSELINQFIGEAIFYPSKYFSINKDFFTSYPISKTFYNKAYIHDTITNSPLYLNFCGEQSYAQLSIIINGGEKGIGVLKEFSSYILTTNNVEFAKVEFETDYMSCDVNPFISNEWTREYIAPEYKEGRWFGSIPINDKDIDSFSSSEFIKGNYLKLILTFDKSDYFYINEIITNFIISSI